MQNKKEKKIFKSGFVSIIGRPNVGKSTLLNSIVGTKISIISPTAQTTRNNIKGIYTDEDCQIIFIDTPGIHKPKNELGEYMNKQSYSSLKDCDLVMWIVDASEEFGGGDTYVINVLKDIKTKVVLVFNKMDLINSDEEKIKFEENKNKFINAFNFASLNYISASNNTNVDTLIKNIANELEEGPMFYDPDEITDSMERFIASELIREKIFLFCKEEVPHSTAVEIEAMKEDVDEEGNDIVNISATILVDRDSQKKIVIGAGGAMVKKIRLAAKRDIKMMLGCNCNLEIFVKVDKGWRDNKLSLNRLGYK